MRPTLSLSSRTSLSRYPRQLPFALSVAINRVAVGARDEVREGLGEKFTLRNQWTLRGIQVLAGSKANPVAFVRAPGYMAIQEAGGVRPGAWAVPSPDLRGGVIPKAERPKQQLASGAFELPLRKGGTGIFRRDGGRLRLMWWKRSGHDYEARFGLAEDVTAYVEQRFPAAFSLAMQQAVAGSR